VWSKEGNTADMELNKGQLLSQSGLLFTKLLEKDFFITLVVAKHSQEILFFSIFLENWRKRKYVSFYF